MDGYRTYTFILSDCKFWTNNPFRRHEIFTITGFIYTGRQHMGKLPMRLSGHTGSSSHLNAQAGIRKPFYTRFSEYFKGGFDDCGIFHPCCRSTQKICQSFCHIKFFLNICFDKGLNSTYTFSQKSKLFNRYLRVAPLCNRMVQPRGNNR